MDLSILLVYFSQFLILGMWIFLCFVFILAPHLAAPWQAHGIIMDARDPTWVRRRQGKRPTGCPVSPTLPGHFYAHH